MVQLSFLVEPDRAALTAVELQVLELIEARKGEGEAISAAELSRIVGIGDRQLRALIKVLVEVRSLCICSSTKGFYVPGSAAEVLDCSHRLLSWGLSALRRARALRRSDELHRLCGQLELELSRVAKALEVADGDVH